MQAAHIIEPIWGLLGFAVALWQLRLRKTWAKIRGAYGLKKHLLVTFPLNRNWKNQVSENEVEIVNLHRSTKAFVTTSPVGRVNTRIIDSKERTTSLQHAGLTPITFIYDTHGRLTQAAQGVSRATTLSYNSGTGFLNSIANSKSEVWRFGYDPSGRVTSITLPDTRAISYGYDSNGNVTSITPPGKAAHSSLFNFFDLISSYLPPLLGGVTSTPTTYSYNNDRQLTQVVRPDSQTITFNYGSTTGTLDSIVQPTGTSTFTYSSGDLVTTTSPDAITHTLGNYGGLTFTEALTYAPSTQTSLVIYNYNSDYLKSEEQVNTSNTTGTNYLFAYDNDGLITSAGDEALTRSGSTGAVTQAAIGTNMKTLFGYSSEYGELSQIQGKYGAAVKYQEDLTRDSLGRLSSRTEKYGSLTNVYGYTYDSAGRLTNVSLNSAAYSTYSYDTNSNRTRQTVSAVTKSPTYDSQDRLSTFGTKAFSYNTNGERTRVVDSSMTPSQATIFAYNSFGDLKTVTLPGAVTVTYHLDAHGRRVAKKKGSTYNAYYVYGKDDKILSVLSSIGAVTMRFIYGSRPNVPDYVIKGPTEYMIVANHLGSPVQVINTSDGTISQELKYDEWGNITSDSNPGFQPFGFAGGLYDQDTKLTHFGSREYDASVGRWLSKDPILFGGRDTNLYGYVLQDPINYIDPTGKVFGVDDAAEAGLAISIVGATVGATSAYINFQSTHSYKSAFQAFGLGFASGATSAGAALLTAGASTAAAIGAAIGIDLGFGFLTAPTNTLSSAVPKGPSDFMNGAGALGGNQQISCPGN